MDLNRRLLSPSAFFGLFYSATLKKLPGLLGIHEICFFFIFFFKKIIEINESYEHDDEGNFIMMSASMCDLGDAVFFIIYLFWGRESTNDEEKKRTLSPKALIWSLTRS